MFKDLRFKNLTCALVAMALVLSPWGSDVLPEPLDRLGAEPALAQQQSSAAVIDGTPADCPPSAPDGPQWEFYGDPPSPLCWVKSYPPSCPESPLAAGGQMSLVADRADLCEAVATEVSDPGIVADCFRVNADGHLVDDNGDPVTQRDANQAEVLDNDGNPVPTNFHSISNPMPAGYSGFVNRYEIVVGEPTCTLLAASRCPTDEGLYRVSRTACRGYMRRTWKCPLTHPVALNQFNRCYVRPAVAPSTGHPACDQNSPVAVIDCEDYVGADFVANPDANACEEFDRRYNEAHPHTEPPFDTFEPAANAHWCAYGVMHLHPKCDRSNASDPDCDPQRTAVCIMRASGIGGCDGVAHRMICSDLQSAYATARGQSPLGQLAVERTLRRLREHDCRPCVLLPFSDASACDPHGLAPTPVESAIGKPSAGDVRVEAVDFQLFAFDRGRYGTVQGRRYHLVDDWAIFARFARMSYTDPVKHPACSPWHSQMLEDMKNGRRPDYSNFPSDACKQQLCSSPTVGRVDWTSEHISGLAVTGTPLIVTIDDIPLRMQTVRYIDRKIPGGDRIAIAGPTQFPTLHRGERKFLVRYDPVTGNEPLLFTREESVISEPSHSINDAYSNRVECSLRDPTKAQRKGEDQILGTDDDVSWYDDGDIPEFGLLITELWPDIDAEEIERLFGTDSLAWWTAMTPAAKSKATEARGYVYIDKIVLSEADIAEERSRRNWVWIEEIPCEGTVPGPQASRALRCRWTPRRAGFYSVQAAGVWRLHTHNVGMGSSRPLEADERRSLEGLLLFDGSLPDTDSPGPDGVCRRRSEKESSEDRDCLIEDLEWMLPGDPPDIPADMTPGEAQNMREQIRLVQMSIRAQVAGLMSNLKGLLDGETTLPDPWGRNCLTLRDFRYTCHPYDPVGVSRSTAATGNALEGASYTTSEPVGVMVHGAQVVSRRPAGSR